MDRKLSRRGLLAALAVSPIALACQQRFPDPPKVAAPAAVALASPTASEPRRVRIALPSHDLFRFWGTRFQNANHKLDPARHVKLTTMTIDVGTATADELPARYGQGIAGLPAAEAPDLFLTGPEEISLLPALAQSGAALDLAPMLKNEKWFKPDDFWGNALQTGRVQGKQVALPAQLGVETLVYNKRLFQEGNINPPPAGWSWDQFIASAKALTRPGQGEQPGRWGMFVGTGTPTLASLAWQHGAQLIPEDGSRIDLTEPGTLRAIELLRDMIETHKVAAPIVTTQLGNPGQQQFGWWPAMNGGRVAMASLVVAGGIFWGNARDPFLIAELPTAEKKAVLGVAPLMLGVPKNAPDPAHSLNALRAIFESSGVTMFLPPTKNIEDLRKAEGLLAESDGPALQNALQIVRFVPGDAPSGLYSVVEREFVAPVLTGAKKPAQAAKDAQAVIDELIKKAKGQ
jgi:ABC-type glycerol-3-phosphate transport system substrate-binding protein